METTREIALRTYKDATEHGMMDTPMNWHIWKRAFNTAERELKNLQLGAVVGRSEQLVCRYCKTELTNPISKRAGYCDSWCVEREEAN